MNLLKSMAYTFGSFSVIAIGIIGILYGYKNDNLVGYVCGIPLLILGIILLIQAYKYINIDFD